MELNLFRYIWRNSWRDQSIILVVVAIAQVFYFVSLDLPKQIVNRAIQGAIDLDQLMADVLDATLSIFDCVPIGNTRRPRGGFRNRRPND